MPSGVGQWAQQTSSEYAHESGGPIALHVVFAEYPQIPPASAQAGSVSADGGAQRAAWHLPPRQRPPPPKQKQLQDGVWSREGHRVRNCRHVLCHGALVDRQRGAAIACEIWTRGHFAHSPARLAPLHWRRRRRRGRTCLRRHRTSGPQTRCRSCGSTRRGSRPRSTRRPAGCRWRPHRPTRPPARGSRRFPRSPT